jgi:hypothetical protein
VVDTLPHDDSFAAGLLVGILIGDGSFGGDGRQPQVTLRLHTRHEALVRWLEQTVPGARLYGPYDHGGRSYFQWTVRGRPLREQLAPFLARHLTPELDGHAHARFQAMCARYGITP